MICIRLYVFDRSFNPTLPNPTLPCFALYYLYSGLKNVKNGGWARHCSFQLYADEMASVAENDDFVFNLVPSLDGQSGRSKSPSATSATENPSATSDFSVP